MVFALDMSNDVSQSDFERMRNILLSLLERMEISDSNCPMGARVAIVSYNAKTDYLVRFSDHKGKPALLQAVRAIPLQGSSGSRNLGEAMRFVARHVFKRVRSGLLVRKVAVFFQAGWSHDQDAFSTATLELSALDITSAIITFTEVHNLPYDLLVSGGESLGGGGLVPAPYPSIKDCTDVYARGGGVLIMDSATSVTTSTNWPLLSAYSELHASQTFISPRLLFNIPKTL